MNKFTIAALLFLSGCVSTGTKIDYASPQNYKLDSKAIKITGQLLTPYRHNEFTGSMVYSRQLIVSFDDKPVIDGYLTAPQAIQGELTGNYQGKKVSSICNSVQTSASNIKVDCMVLIDNERTITLTF